MLYVKKCPWMGLWVDVLVARSKRGLLRTGILCCLYECQTTRPADNSDRDKSARMLRQLGPYYCFIRCQTTI